MDINQVMKAPGDFFASPHDLVASSDFSPEQKLAILKQWEDEELQLIRANEENMADDEADDSVDAELLAAIRSCIFTLEHA